MPSRRTASSSRLLTSRRRRAFRRAVAVFTVFAFSWMFALSSADAATWGGFPLPHLPSPAQVAAWFESPDWGSLPKQATGTAAGKSPDASAADTRAGKGVGHKPGVGKGQLPAYAPYIAPLKPGRAGAHAAGGVFNAKTSTFVPAKSTATTSYWQNADGSVTKHVSQQPVNYQAEPGVWEPIDTALAKAADGRYAERANSLGVSVAARTGQSALDAGAGAATNAAKSATTTPATTTPTTTPAAATATDDLAQVQISATQSAGWSLMGAADVTAAVSASVATYDGILPDTNITEEAGTSGDKESIVLTSAAAANSWTFPLNLSGLTPSIDATGAVAFTDAAGAVVARMPLAYAADSAVNAGSGLPATTWNVSYALTTVGGLPAVTVTLDPTWLDASARVFPVTVDPTFLVSIVGTTSTTYVNTDGSVDYSSSTYTETGECTALACGNLDDANGLIDFANSKQLDDEGYTVSSASVNLFDTWTAVSIGSADCTTANASDFTWSAINVLPINEGWSVTGAKAYPGPTVGASIGTASPATWDACKNTAGSLAVGDWVSVPVSASWAQSVSYGETPDYGLAIRGATGSLSWRLYDSDLESSDTPYLSITYTDQAPQVTAQYPPNGYSAPTLTPELLASAVKAPNSQTSTAFTYQFTVFNAAGTAVATSPSLSTGDWTVPSGDLSWSTTYYWTVEVGDGIASSVPQALQSLTIAVPQPTITSLLSQDTSDQGFDAASGNYTTSAVDADISVVGPSLEVERDYNAEDPRVAGAFGAAWSSIFDARATEVDNAAGAVTSVTVTYPDGSEVGFGLNTNGTYAPPPGRFATFDKVTGGYTLTDKNDTVYTFTQSLGSGAYGITSVSDANGVSAGAAANPRTLTFAWTGTQITTLTSKASGRALHLTWSTPTGATAPHVATVATDPVVVGTASSAETWQYAYTGDDLTSVCQPNSTTATPVCTKYTYTAGSAYQSAALDAGPHSLWPLGEASGTTANDAVLANEGADNGTYSNVTLAAAGPSGVAAATSASFLAANDPYVALPTSLANSASYESVGLWFKTTATGEVLFSYSAAALPAASTAADYTPSLYVGTDGKLNAEFWYASGTVPIVTSTAVNDGNWHFAVLSAAGSTQTLWLDGRSVGSVTGAVSVGTGGLTATQDNDYIGGGFLGGTWPDESHASTTSDTGYASYFTGNIAGVGFYSRPLVQSDVSALYAAGTTKSTLLTGITRPSGKAYATVTYNTATSRATHLTDENGGSWTINTPVVKGSSDVYRSAVMGSNPSGYYRLNDPVGSSYAMSQENYGAATYNGGVTLGEPGPFGDQTAAGFDGSSGYVQLPTTDQVSTGPNSVELWFKVPAGNTSGGVLFDEEQNSLTGGSPAGGGYDPALYVGTDGRLHAEFWVNNIADALVSSSLVNDGDWHYVVLSATTNSQTLYLDGNSVSTLNATLSATGLGNIYVGAGESGGTWPFQPANTLGYFTGSIAEVAFYRSQLSAADVADHYAAYKSGTADLAPTEYATVTDPGGKTLTYEYDLSNGTRQISYTDGRGATTTYGYDSDGFQDTTTDADGDVTVQGHDVRGNVVSQATCQDQALNECSTVYYTYLPDDTTDPLTTAAATNDELATERDGRSASATDPTYETQYEYDAYGDQTETITPPVPGSPAGRATVTVYSTPANPVLAVGSTTADIPDGLPVETISPGGAVSTVAYFADGDVAATRDADGLVTEFTYDGIGEVLTKTTVPNTPVGWWPLNQTSGTAVADTSAAGDNLTASNVTWSGGAASLNGSTSQIAASGPILNTADDYSVSAWVDIPSVPTSYATVLGLSANGTTVSQLTYSLYSHAWVFAVTDTSDSSPNYYTAAAATAPATGVWTHLVGVYSTAAQSVSLYVNGALAGTSWAPKSTQVNGDFTIGSVAGVDFLDGSVANVQLYQRALSPSEVTALYTAGHAGTVAAGTSAPGSVTSYQYDKAGQVTQETDPAVTDTLNAADVHTAVTATVYDLDGDITSQTVSDATGGDAPRTTTSTYNAYDQLASTTDANGNAGDANGATTTYTYDAYGNKATDVDQDGNTTEYTYDADGNILTQGVLYTGSPLSPTSPTLLTESSRAYDPAGRLASITDSLGNVTSYTYTDNGLTSTVTRKDPGGADVFVLQSNLYDAAGNLRQQSTNNGETVDNFTVDAADRTTATSEDPTGVDRTTTVSYTPDDEAATVTQTDSSGYDRTTTAAYDPMGNTTSTTVLGDATGHPTGWWPLNQTAGTTVTDASGTGNTAAASNVTWTGDSGTFNGTTSQVATNGPVLNTTASYSVSAWVNETADTTAQTFVSQTGVNSSAFLLQNDPTTKEWRLSATSGDVTTPTYTGVEGTGGITLNTWTHLVGVYNSATQTISLYINGALAGSAAYTTPWSSSGPLAIGRDQQTAAANQFTNGQIANVQAYPQALTAAQIATLYTNGQNGGTLGSSTGETTSWTYNPLGQQTSMTDADDNTTGYSYDQAGQLDETVDPPVAVETNGGAPYQDRPTTQTQYDTFGDPVATLDPNGNETTYVYDADGQKVSQTDPQYTPAGSTTPITATTVWAYDALGDMTKETQPDLESTEYLYDQLGDVVQTTDPDSGTTDAAFDTNGDETSTTDADGAQTQATYDWMGRQITGTQLERYPTAQTLTTRDSYTPSTGNPSGAFLSSETSPDGVATTYGYNAVGEQTSQTDAAGNTTSYTYDYTGQPFTTTLPDGSHTETDYNADEEPVLQKTFDTTGDLISDTSATFDGDGNALSATDARGNTTTFTYDATGMVSQEVQPVSATSSITTSFGYDADGNRTRSTDGRGNATYDTYTPWNQPQTVVEPETSTDDTAALSTTTYAYNGDGQPVSQTDPSGAALSLAYNGDGEVTTESGTGAAAATATLTFNYDGDGDVTSASTAAAGTSGQAGYQPATSESATYNDRGAPLSTSGSAGSSSFAYNGDGLLTSQADAAGTTSYTYDGDDRLQTLSDPASGTTLTYGYNTLSQPASIQYAASGDTRAYTYNATHQLASDTLKTSGGTPVASISYGYDPDGNLTSKTTSGFEGSAGNTYGYDEANRLTSWTAGTGTTAYSYDASGNRTRAGSNVYTYDARDELTSDGVNTYTYTADGTLSQQSAASGDTAFTSDAYGRQITAGTQTYGLDATGRDITDTTAGTGTGGTGATTRTFQYDGTSDLVASDGSNTYTYDPAGGLIGVNAAGATSTATGSLALTDQHQDVVGDFTANSAALSGSTTYDPLGNVLATSDPAGSLGYESAWTDSATGKADLGSRWYNPATGEFLNKDTAAPNPVPDSVSANPFAYVDDNPLIGTDPSGHCSSWDWACDVGSYVKKVAQKAVKKFEHAVQDASTFVSALYDRGAMMAAALARAMARTVSAAAHRVSDAYHAVTQEVRHVYRYAAKRVTRVYRAAVHAVKTAYHAVKKAAKATATFVKHHAAAITSFVVSTAVFMGCEGATLGVGSIGCAAIAGAVGSLVTQGFKCASGTAGACSAGAFATSALTGAATGALGGALGELGGALLGKLAPKALDAIGGLFGKGVSDAGEDAADTAGDDAADDATKQAADSESSQSATSSTDGSSSDAPQTDAQTSGDPNAGSDADSDADEPKGCSSCPCDQAHSFVGSTDVVMGDGSTKPIDQIKAGDTITDSVPGQNSTQTNTVTAVITTHTDHDFVNVTITPTGPSTPPATSVSTSSTARKPATSTRTSPAAAAPVASTSAPAENAASSSAVSPGATASVRSLLRKSTVGLAAGIAALAVGLGSSGSSPNDPPATSVPGIPTAPWSSTATAPAANSLTLAAQSTASATSAAQASDGGTITTTFHHPFYDETQDAFVQAENLHIGDTLQTTTGTAHITNLHLFHANTTTYDLTIGELHTYYVVAGGTPILVHNSNCPDGSAVVYRSPGTGNKASEARGLNAANHAGDHPTAYLSNLPEGAAHYAGNGHDLGMHVFTMKPGFRQAFGNLEFPLENSMGLTEGLTEWRIPADRFDEFNSYIDHGSTEWWDAADGHFFPPPGSIHSQ